MRKYKRDAEIEAIEKELEQHRKNKSRFQLLVLEEQEVRGKLEFFSPSELTASRTDGISVKTNGFHSVVENVVMVKEKRQGKVELLDARLKDITKEKKELQKSILKVEAYLNCLETLERYIIEKFYLEKLTWRYIQEAYKKDFEYKDISTIKRIRNRGLANIKDVKAGLRN